MACSRRTTHRAPLLLLASSAVLQRTAQAEAPAYELEQAYVGPDFFRKWHFFTEEDPTHGSVTYVDEATAEMDGMISATAEGVYMSVERTRNTTGTKRNSVRLHSNLVFNGGLFIIDVAHMPVGCGTWPAFWMFGADEQHVWPAWGEYDIIETMHNNPQSMTTLHTGANCRQANVIANKHFTEQWKSGASGGPANDCNINAPGQYQNQGCSQQSAPASSGPAFNAANGGTFAGEWDPVVGHIRTWFWQHGTEPQDVLEGRPSPDSWGRPNSFFSLQRDDCPPEHFRNMRLIFNTALCGDLGNAVFAESCPVEAQKMTCEEYVSDPSRMSEAYWSIRGLDVFTRKNADNDYVLFAEHPEAYPLQNPFGKPESPISRLRKNRIFAPMLLISGLCGLVFIMRVELARCYLRLTGNLPNEAELARRREAQLQSRRGRTRTPSDLEQQEPMMSKTTQKARAGSADSGLGFDFVKTLSLPGKLQFNAHSPQMKHGHGQAARENRQRGRSTSSDVSTLEGTSGWSSRTTSFSDFLPTYPQARL